VPTLIVPQMREFWHIRKTYRYISLLVMNDKDDLADDRLEWLCLC